MLHPALHTYKMSLTESRSDIVGASLPGQNMRPIDIHFEDLCCTVTELKFGIWSTEKKEILKNVSGDFQSSKLTALVGESGGGKSTILNVISGYRFKGVSGRVFMNGTEINMKYLVKNSCYIMQEALLQPLLTPYEAMMFVATLKLNNVVKQQRENIVSQHLKKFSLWEHRNTLTKNLSGGEQKRLAIVLELINNPSICILDEPTSGLDSRSARECLQILRDLSTEGRTIVCSIHQPSMLLLKMFDNAYILSNGLCVYQGAIANLVQYLSDNGVECPIFHNPVEYLLEICTSDGQDGDRIRKLARSIDNGKSQKWLAIATCWNTIPVNQSEMLNRNYLRPNTTEFEGGLLHTASSWHQCCSLLKRKLLILTRDEFLTWLQFLANAITGISSGLFFYNKGNDAEWVFFNFNMIFFVVMSALFNGFMSKIIAFKEEFKIVEREHFNRWYSVKAHLLVTTITDVPVQVIGVSMMSSLFYYLAGYPMEWSRMAKFTGISILLALLSQDYGMLLGTLFDTKHCLIFGVASLAPWVMFSGFFIYYRDCPAKLCQWIFEASALRRAFEGAFISVYSYGRKSMDCYKIFCYYKDPETFIKHVDMANSSYWFNFTFVLMFFICVKCCCLSAMRYKLSHRT